MMFLILFLLIFCNLQFLILTSPAGSESQINGTAAVCNTQECLRSAENLKKIMNPNVDPCDDFYEYVCGNYGKHHPIIEEYQVSSWLHILSDESQKKIKAYLSEKSKPTDPEAVKKVRDLYSLCNNIELRNSKGLSDLGGVLQKIGLPIHPPFVNYSSNFVWYAVAGKIQQYSGNGVYFTISSNRDYKNASVKRIAIVTPENTKLANKLKKKTLKKVSSGDELQGQNTIHTYTKYVGAVMDEFSKLAGVDITTKDYSKQKNEALSELMKFENTISEVNDELSQKSSDILNTMSLKELQEYTNELVGKQDGVAKFNWLEYVRLFFHNIKNVVILNDNEIIEVENPALVRKMISLAVSTTPQFQEMYLWWKVVSTYSSYTKLASIHEGVLKSEASGETCLAICNNLMGMAVSSYYTITDPKYAVIKSKVSKLIGHVRHGFRKVVDDVDWMGENTKNITLVKEKNMGVYAAYPDWLSNSTFLDQQYSEVVIQKDNFLETWTNELQRLILKSLNTLRSPSSGNIEASGIEPTEVNAFYSPEQNIIVVPASILDFPFHQNGLESLNYGAIGAVLGHEITHGFDNTGSKFSANGTLEKWWDEKTLQQYTKRSKCFVDYYNNLTTDVGMAVDGNETLNENIADNGGFKEALIAYRKHMELMGQEPLLPGFEQFSHEKLFTISYANIWCQAETKLHAFLSLLQDNHSPNPVRVRGVLSNSKDFSEIWKCKKGTKMNPDTKKCYIW